MLMPTEENHLEYWWLRDGLGECHVVQIWADKNTLFYHGGPAFFWAGDECEQPVNNPKITWLGRVEPPKSEEDA